VASVYAIPIIDASEGADSPCINDEKATKKKVVVNVLNMFIFMV